MSRVCLLMSRVCLLVNLRTVDDARWPLLPLLRACSSFSKLCLCGFGLRDSSPSCQVVTLLTRLSLASPCLCRTASVSLPVAYALH
jgi:hypothetical protein